MFTLANVYNERDGERILRRGGYKTVIQRQYALSDQKTFCKHHARQFVLNQRLDLNNGGEHGLGFD
jgi:hypothetical protein